MGVSDGRNEHCVNCMLRHVSKRVCCAQQAFVHVVSGSVVVETTTLYRGWFSQQSMLLRLSLPPRPNRCVSYTKKVIVGGRDCESAPLFETTYLNISLNHLNTKRGCVRGTTHCTRGGAT